MADIVLIHGSWHWSGCFHRLIPLLTAAGHRVRAVDNASHGGDTTAWDTIDSMASYTQNAATALAEATEPVVLLGHSMGGVSVSYLAETMPEKVSKLIYLTAFMTAPGKSAHDHIMAHDENPVCAPLWSVLTPVRDFAGRELADRFRRLVSVDRQVPQSDVRREIRDDVQRHRMSLLLGSRNRRHVGPRC